MGSNITIITMIRKKKTEPKQWIKEEYFNKELEIISKSNELDRTTAYWMQQKIASVNRKRAY